MKGFGEKEKHNTQSGRYGDGNQARQWRFFYFNIGRR
jgi:hypothetical protein